MLLFRIKNNYLKFSFSLCVPCPLWLSLKCNSLRSQRALRRILIPPCPPLKKGGINFFMIFSVLHPCKPFKFYLIKKITHPELAELPEKELNKFNKKFFSLCSLWALREINFWLRLCRIRHGINPCLTPNSVS